MPLENRERTRDWLATVPVIILYFLLQYFVQEERAFVTSLTVYVFYVVMSRKWNMRRCKAFWVAIGLLALVHVIIIINIQFPEYEGPSLISFPFVVSDGFLMYWILNEIDKD